MLKHSYCNYFPTYLSFIEHTVAALIEAILKNDKKISRSNLHMCYIM